MTATSAKPVMITGPDSQYLDTESAAYFVRDPDHFKRLIDNGALATRVMGGRRVIHIDALESLTDHECERW